MHGMGLTLFISEILSIEQEKSFCFHVFIHRTSLNLEWWPSLACTLHYYFYCTRVVFLIYSTNSSLKSCKLEWICWMLLLRLLAYFRNRSCWRPLQIVTGLEDEELGISPVIVTFMGYASIRFWMILASGKIWRTQSAAVRNSWNPPSQFWH
jgi:hypothetical protein